MDAGCGRTRRPLVAGSDRSRLSTTVNCGGRREYRRQTAGVEYLRCGFRAGFFAWSKQRPFLHISIDRGRSEFPLPDAQRQRRRRVASAACSLFPPSPSPPPLGPARGVRPQLRTLIDLSQTPACSTVARRRITDIAYPAFSPADRYTFHARRRALASLRCPRLLLATALRSSLRLVRCPGCTIVVGIPTSLNRAFVCSNKVPRQLRLLAAPSLAPETRRDPLRTEPARPGVDDDGGRVREPVCDGRAQGPGMGADGA